MRDHGACYRNKKAGNLWDAAGFSFFLPRILGDWENGGAINY